MIHDSEELFHNLIASNRHFQIKLLGDSITHGVGGTGFQQNGKQIVGGFSRNPDGFCWAKLFADYMQKTYPCEVINNACTGTDIGFIIQNFDALVSDEDDLILCMIGTNNRHQFFSQGSKHTREEHMDAFYKRIPELYERFRNAGKTVIFMANIPASEQNECDGTDYWRIIHMNDINDLYKRASEEYHFPFISLYDLFTGYCRENSVVLDTMLADGLHPNDEGYRVMFELLKKTFHI